MTKKKTIEIREQTSLKITFLVEYREYSTRKRISLKKKKKRHAKQSKWWDNMKFHHHEYDRLLLAWLILRLLRLFFCCRVEKRKKNKRITAFMALRRRREIKLYAMQSRNEYLKEKKDEQKPTHQRTTHDTILIFHAYVS